MRQSILVIGDCHFPWALPRTLNAIYDVVAKTRPQVIIQVGDLYDLFSFSKFPRTHNIMTPRQELTRARTCAEVFWSKMIAAAPNAKRFQLLGNHDDRIWKRTFEAMPELESLIGNPLKNMFSFSKVESFDSSRENLIIGKICFIHGFRSRIGDHARHNGMSTVCGHSHMGGVVYERLGSKTIWELNAGYVGNPMARALSYGMQRRFSRWTQGYGIIDSLGPRFVALPNP